MVYLFLTKANLGPLLPSFLPACVIYCNAFPFQVNTSKYNSRELIVLNWQLWGWGSPVNYIGVHKCADTLKRNEIRGI